MAKPLDPLLVKILNEYGEDAKTAAWDCHGTWVIYHKAIERIAAKAGVTFDMPEIVTADALNRTAVIVARGFMGERSEWSFGEATPANNKNVYPFAMAEKRAKDRVVLKLVGLHGLAYSEEEADDFKPAAEPPAKSSASLKREDVWSDFQADMQDVKTLIGLEKFRTVWREKAIKDGWNAAFKTAAKDAIEAKEAELRKAMSEDAENLIKETWPGSQVVSDNHISTIQAG